MKLPQLINRTPNSSNPTHRYVESTEEHYKSYGKGAKFLQYRNKSNQLGKVLRKINGQSTANGTTQGTYIFSPTINSLLSHQNQRTESLQEESEAIEERDKQLIEKYKGGYRYTTNINSYKIQRELGKLRGKSMEIHEKIARSINTLLTMHTKRLNVKVNDSRDMGSVDLNQIKSNELRGNLMSINDITYESNQLKKSLFSRSPKREETVDYSEYFNSYRPRRVGLAARFHSHKKAQASTSVTGSELWWRLYIIFNKISGNNFEIKKYIHILTQKNYNIN